MTLLKTHNLIWGSKGGHPPLGNTPPILRGIIPLRPLYGRQ
jgi:hypothetical protein